MLAESSPANFTSAVWIEVTDSDAIDDRFAPFEIFDPYEMAASLAGKIAA